jgi:hypothetical protein
MVADTLKSASITNLDAQPFIQNNAGVGAGGELKTISDFVAMTTGGLASTSSTYKMVRLQSNVILKSLNLLFSTAPDSNGSPTLTFDVGAYYSDSTTDGTAVANQGTAISATAFASAFATTATNSSKGVKNNVFLNPATNLFNSQLWAQLGLATDPGGCIDIVLAVHAAAATAVASTACIEASFTK